MVPGDEGAEYVEGDDGPSLALPEQDVHVGLRELDASTEVLECLAERRCRQRFCGLCRLVGWLVVRQGSFILKAGQ